MLILLPPSEGKTALRRGKSLDLDALSFSSLRLPRAEMLDALVGLCTAEGAAGPDGAARTLGLGRTQSGEVARNARLRDAPTARADRVYSGVLFEALDVASLQGAARRRAARSIAITSGLFGLLRPTDHIPAYRLAGDVALPGLGTVSTFWHRHLDAAVREAAGTGLVVDLRSSTYASFWRPDAETATRVVSIRVLHEVDGTRKVVSHFNKATKGRIVRDLLVDGANPARPNRFADHLARLGWNVEPEASGTRLDVVVSDL